MSSKVKIIHLNELTGMPTAALVGRRTELLKCEESFKCSDRYGYEDQPDPDKTGYIEFKDQSHWLSAHNDVKEILKHREHVPTAAERKIRRQEQSKKKH